MVHVVSGASTLTDGCLDARSCPSAAALVAGLSSHGQLLAANLPPLHCTLLKLCAVAFTCLAQCLQSTLTWPTETST